ncbi:MAG: ECF-type sigma factor [Xanthomonadales bacterium]|jgi:RNA polymerase sigma factor (TIGR02999 family)|nr:ECF-type sigma factor [Xanthomonadales bacterium]
MDAPPDAVNEHLRHWRAGEPAALDRLLPLVYDELRRMAASQLRRHAGHATLQPTALVHEVLLRLLGAGAVDFENATHWYATAARLMRQILVDRARAQQRDKRGGGAQRVPLVEAVGLPIDHDTDLLDLDLALDALAARDPRVAQVAELRCFVGLEVAEIATLLDIDERTVYRDWALARAWLRQRAGAPP